MSLLDRVIPRSKQLDLGLYETDKIGIGYLDRYDLMFTSLVDAEIKLLELGIYRGGSLFLWRDYFPNGTIVGVDVDVRIDVSREERIHVYQGSQEDTVFLTRVAEEVAPDGFDVIIDDASHLGEPTRACFWHLFDRHLKPGGLYVVEDWGTGYWDSWPDGRSVGPPQRRRGAFDAFRRSRRRPDPTRSPSHDYGMVGFVKQLVDEQGYEDLSRGLSGGSRRGSKFERMVIYPAILFVQKRAA